MGDVAAVQGSAMNEFPAPGVEFQRVIPITTQAQEYEINGQKEWAKEPVLHAVASLVHSEVGTGRGCVEHTVAECKGGNAQVSADPEHRSAAQQYLQGVAGPLPFSTACQAQQNAEKRVRRSPYMPEPAQPGAIPLEMTGFRIHE